MNVKRSFSAWLVLSALSAAAEVSAAPPNDDFADATVLEGPSGRVEGTNVGATRQASEPMIDGYEGGRSVWWRWMAPAAGEVNVQTFGSDFDTILGVYTGTALASLQLVAENDDTESGEGLHSVVTFTAIAGTIYHFAVDGVDGDPGPETGDVVLSWLSGAPPNDDFAAGLVVDGDPGRVEGFNLGATREPGEPMIEDNEGGRSVWWRWVAPRTESVSVFTFGSDFDTLLGVYTGTAVNALTLIGENDDAEAGQGGGGGVLKRPAPCRPPRPGCGRPPPDDTSIQSRVDFEATAGMLYHFLVDGYDGESGNIVLTVAPNAGGPPGNDMFADRTRLDGPDGQVLGDSSGATEEAGEPDHVQSGGTQSVWWSWVAPGDGTGEIDTLGSSFDTVLAVYTGASVSALALVAENDDDERTDTLTSAVRFRVVAGTEYQIAVDGYEGESGIVLLSWSFTPGPENPRFIRGDCDGDGLANLTDAVCTLEWLFRGGEEPQCIAATNAAGIGGVNITDAVHLLLHLFAGGPPPAAPFPECGVGTLASDGEVGCWTPPESCR
jgi:hypothetical protein